MIGVGRTIAYVSSYNLAVAQKRALKWILEHAESIDEAMKFDVNKMAQNMVNNLSIFIFNANDDQE